jgi:hypothetical protein
MRGDAFTDCAYGDEVAGCAGQVDADYCREDPGVMKQCCGTCHSLMRRGNLDFLGECFLCFSLVQVQIFDKPEAGPSPVPMVRSAKWDKPHLITWMKLLCVVILIGHIHQVIIAVEHPDSNASSS